MDRTITVKGTGKVSVSPDYITLTMEVSDVKKKYDEAVSACSKRTSALEKAAEKAGLPEKSLKTTRFNVSTEYKNVRSADGSYSEVFVGYRCTYDLKLSFDFDAEKLSAVIGSLTASKAEPHLNIQFTVKDPSKVSAGILRSAAQNALEKAKALCEASGVRLGRLLRIDYDFSERDLVSRSTFDLGESRVMMAKSAAPAGNFVPEDIDLSDSAAFTWEID